MYLVRGLKYLLLIMGIQIGKQWSETVGNGGRLYWEPRSTTDCSTWARGRKRRRRGQLCPLSPFKYLGPSCWHNGKCQNVFENSCCKNTFPVAVEVLTNKRVI
jgi:hypothetical protein